MTTLMDWRCLELACEMLSMHVRHVRRRAVGKLVVASTPCFSETMKTALVARQTQVCSSYFSHPSVDSACVVYAYLISQASWSPEFESCSRFPSAAHLTSFRPSRQKSAVFNFPCLGRHCRREGVWVANSKLILSRGQVNFLRVRIHHQCFLSFSPLTELSSQLQNEHLPAIRPSVHGFVHHP